jgi:hypothetical protein
MTALNDIRALALADIQKTYENTAAELENLRQRRNGVVFEAARDGWTHAMISRATRSTGARGLTRSRVGQLMMSTHERVTHRVQCVSCGEHYAVVVGPPSWSEEDVLNAFRENGRVVDERVVCSRCADDRSAS